jgi:transposase-like protein
MERRRFTREFKLEAVRLIRDRGVSYAQATAASRRPLPPQMDC